MISESAKSSIAWLFEEAIRDNSIADAGDHCKIKYSKATTPQHHADGHLVVLSIASYMFRIVALFNFKKNAATTKHLAKISRCADQDLRGQALDDAYAELVNMICGEVNRGLRTDFHHSGMSTPFALESSCAQYVSILTPTEVQFYEVTINDDVTYDLIVCICTSGSACLDFVVDRSSKEKDTSGELELF